MAFQPCPNIAEFTFQQIMYDTYAYNVIHVQRDGGWSPSNLATMAESLCDGWVTNILPLVVTSFALVSVKHRDLSTEGAEAGIVTAQGAVGTAVGEPLPYLVSLCVTLRTALAGRSYRGRLYQPGLPVSLSVSAIATNAGALALKNAWDNMRGVCTSQAGARMVVLSRYHNKVKRENGIGTTVTRIDVNRAFDAQHGRNPHVDLWAS